MPEIAIAQPSAPDIDAIHAVLTKAYWSPGIPRETVARACANSICAIARDDSGKLIGFARLVTDRATFAWLCDVIVMPEHQGQGIGRGLVKAFQTHPDLQNLRRWMLGTLDAHGVYQPLGFTAVDEPQRMMHIFKRNPYGIPTDQSVLLAGKVAIVTGANTGIGQGIAIALAEAGADIAAVGRTPPTETQERVLALGRSFLTVKADLSSSKNLDGVIAVTQHTFGRADILVNNAGTIRRADAVDFTEQDWDDVMNVNLKSVFFLSQAFAKHAIAVKQKAKIIQIASLLSFQGGIRVPSYTAAKSGLAGITKLMANEWAAKGINVNAIAPGYFVTNNTEALRKDETRSRDILARIPAGRWGEPSDLGGAAVFLASSASDYVHGTIIPVDGGWLAR